MSVMGRPDMPPLRSEDLDPDPIEMFGGWYERAAEDVPLADAMCLATVDAAGDPDARMVLLKGFDERGFRFYTNSRSVKGTQLREHERASLVIYWRELDRQVRVRGGVEMVSAEQADEYWASRPRDSQLGAWASPQSMPLADRETLDRAVEKLEANYEGDEVPRPPHWNGYRVIPEEIEFWQGQNGRLHDRFRYRRDDPAARWEIERLAP